MKKTLTAKLTIGILLFLFATNSFGQIKTISKEEMIQDIDTLFSTIEQVHPDMCAVYPKQQLEKEIEQIKSELEASGDIFYFFKQIAPVVAKLGDGHTGVGFPRHALENVPHLFPFAVKVTYPDKIIRVQNDYTQTQNTIPVGAQITRINNRDAVEMVQEMMNYESGEKDFFKVARLEYLFTPLIYALYRDTIFNIEYQFNEKNDAVQVKGVSYKERFENGSQKSVSVSSKPYTFSVLRDKNIGIIEFNSFVNLKKFKRFLSSTFHKLRKKNIKNLIIDIRKNGGGNSALGDELLQYISPAPFAQFGKTTVKISDPLKQFLNTNYKWKMPQPNGIETYPNSHLIELKKNKLRYKGDVFLLISHYTFSSAADFSWAFKYFKVGTVVGEETGGLAVCFGDIITPKLPNSGVSYSVSWKKFYGYGATDENTHGTLPDYAVEAEKALDFAIDLIKRGK
jgi:C-terminal processing protease CtpA/Prc